MIFCATLVSWYNSGSGTRPWPIPIINRFSFWIREQTSKSVTNSSVYAFDRRQKQEKWLAIKRKTRLLTVWRCCKLGIYLRRVYLKPKMFTFFTLFLSLSFNIHPSQFYPFVLLVEGSHSYDQNFGVYSTQRYSLSLKCEHAEDM